MSDFRKLSDSVLASPQLTLADVAEASAMGVTLIVNNRPEREAEDQTSGPAIEAAARAAGMDYLAIPITPGAFDDAQVRAMAHALSQARGSVLAYCRTGTRSTLLWALAQAANRKPLKAIASAASAAGYDISPVLPAMVELSRRAQG
jgi:uncharacterized protein (TIGR01244 family)|uniref:TIGR01244 family sulfur transferase n=1 Tax=Altererythrobacter segetis TaxID=1104773 RepID=UPI00140A7740|nr:TIGR01244 family sulfur transferase [Altererythrobacter segetis]